MITFLPHYFANHPARILFSSFFFYETTSYGIARGKLAERGSSTEGNEYCLEITEFHLCKNSFLNSFGCDVFFSYLFFFSFYKYIFFCASFFYCGILTQNMYIRSNRTQEFILSLSFSFRAINLKITLH